MQYMTCQKEVGKGYNKDFEKALEEEIQIFLGDGFTTDRHTIPTLLRVGVVSEENRECCSGVRQELKAHTVMLARLLLLDHHINSDH